MELNIRNLIRRLILAVMWSLLLHSIVGQVDLSLKIVNIELVGGSANVSFLKPVCFEDSINLADHHVVPDVELPPLIEERPINIELHYERLFTPIVMDFLRFDDRI